MNSKAQVVRENLVKCCKFTFAVCCLPFAVYVWRLPFAVNLTLDLFIGGNLPRNINKQISLFALKRSVTMPEAINLILELYEELFAACLQIVTATLIYLLGSQYANRKYLKFSPKGIEVT